MRASQGLYQIGHVRGYPNARDESNSGFDQAKLREPRSVQMSEKKSSKREVPFA